MTISQGAEDFKDGFRCGLLIDAPKDTPSKPSLILIGFLLGIFAHSAWVYVVTP